MPHAWAGALLRLRHLDGEAKGSCSRAISCDSRVGVTAMENDVAGPSLLLEDYRTTSSSPRPRDVFSRSSFAVSLQGAL